MRPIEPRPLAGPTVVLSWVAALWLGALGGTAWAAPPEAPPEPIAKEVSPARGEWPGFRVEVPGRDSEVRVRGLVQADGLFFIDDERDQSDRFEIRRARVALQGKIGKVFGFRVEPQWTPGNVVLLDAYVDVRVFDALIVRAGKQKTPLGLEMLQPVTALILPERGLSTALVPLRDIGVQVLGEVAGGVFSFAAGVGSGAADQVLPDGNVDDAFDAYGRVFVQPFRASESPALRDLGVGVAGSWGRETGGEADGGLGRYRTGARDTFARFADDVVADGDRWRLNPQLWWYFGAFGLIGEYVYSEQEVRRGADARAVGHHAWTAGASYVMTRERASYRGVTPAHTGGAFEVAARFGELHLDDGAIEAGLFRAGAPDVVRAWGASLNYWAHAAVRAQLAFEQTRFERPGAASRSPENALYLRLQAAP